MKIVNNSEEKKSLFSNKKAVAITGVVAALLVVCVGVFVFTRTDDADTVNADPIEVVEPQPETDEVEDQIVAKTEEGNGMSLDVEVVEPEEIDLTDPSVDLYDQDVIDQTGGWVAVSTGIRTNRDELIQTVIDAVNDAKIGVEEVENEAQEAVNGLPDADGLDGEEIIEVEGNVTRTVIPRLLEKIRDENSDLDEQFMLDGDDGELTSPFMPTSEVWGYTYNVWASILGDYVYRHPENATFNEYAGAMSGVYHGMIAYDVFDFDMSKASDWNVGGVADTQFIEHMPIHWRVEFTYENEVYVALLGVLDGKYGVIDVVRDGDPDSAWVNQVVIQYVEPEVTTVPDYSNSTPDANGTGSEMFIPDDDPSRGGSSDNYSDDYPEGMPYYPGTPGGIIIQEFDPSNTTLIPKPEGMSNDFNSGYDPENPHPIPGMG